MLRNISLEMKQPLNWPLKVAQFGKVFDKMGCFVKCFAWDFISARSDKVEEATQFGIL